MHLQADVEDLAVAFTIILSTFLPFSFLLSHPFSTVELSAHNSVVLLGAGMLVECLPSTSPHHSYNS